METDRDGKAIGRASLVNVSHESYAIPTPSVPLPKVHADRRPLAGIKVLEMVRIIAGPTVGATLAAFGADVIRVNCSKLADLNVGSFLRPINCIRKGRPYSYIPMTGFATRSKRWKTDHRS